MGLRGLIETLTKIAAEPEKDFGELVRQRRRKRGLPVAPAGKVLPFAPKRRQEDAAERAALDAAAEAVLGEDTPTDELRAARMLLAERRLRETLSVLEDAECLCGSPQLEKLELNYQQALASYQVLCQIEAHAALGSLGNEEAT